MPVVCGEIVPPVLVAVRNRIGHLTLNRPAELNRLSLPMIRQLWEQLHLWAVDPSILVVVLRAIGEEAFCVGIDSPRLDDSEACIDAQRFALIKKNALIHYIHSYPKPILALMDGLVLSDGMGLAQGATFRVISGRVKMGLPQVRAGYFPDAGASYFLPRLPGELGIYLGVTGSQIRTVDALYSRLADWCLPSDHLKAFDHGLDNLSENKPPRDALHSLLRTYAADKLPGAELKAFRRGIDEYFSIPDLPSIRQALLMEDRAEYQDWAEETVTLMDSRSSFAMTVTLEMLRRGRVLSLIDCFALERHLHRGWMSHEGTVMRDLFSHTQANAEQVRRLLAAPDLFRK
ncbi:enoyl-CoA hydratase/isomerase family protein [Pseudomonas corrugata]|uniref:enoyl-CoA hydratase/isomerase family protein n=1 Tax=Pseudomonas corrugata TaxID=47879 RepID=UPI001585D4F8|nr:enoyl-CoA hydratase/isomerase family protein [Pseudomonas corrugata]MCI0995627.1 enoyl-CoA hydratase/isomerase family protein [Pseudomonas corrugata]NUT64678.1 enoyl-CoA hydratase/isomerase family protein [Pseudomonas corrugata]